jgi:hypothetical protein
MDILRLCLIFRAVGFYSIGDIYVVHTADILVIITPTNLRAGQYIFVSYYNTPTCFGTEVPSSARRSVQRNVGPTRRTIIMSHIDWRVGSTLLCIERLADDGVLVPKHVGVL